VFSFAFTVFAVPLQGFGRRVRGKGEGRRRKDEKSPKAFVGYWAHKSAESLTDKNRAKSVHCFNPE
jgi:hypothetical protein